MTPERSVASIEDVERVVDERLAALYAETPLSENELLRRYLRAAYGRGLMDATERPFPFLGLYKQPPLPSPYAWAIGKTFDFIPQVETVEMWGPETARFKAELEQWLAEWEAERAA